MKPKPFSLIPALAENTYVYLFQYVGDDNDFETDKTAFNTELEKHFLANTTLGMPEKGLDVTGATNLTVTDAAGKRVIALASAKDITASSVDYPLVLYKGVAVPYSDFDGGVTPWAKGTCTLTLKAGTTAKYPSETETDWQIFYSDHLLGTLVSLDAGDVSLPLESNAFNAVGHLDPVIRTTRRTDPESNGSITVMESMTSFLFDSLTAPENTPGEDLLARVYGSEWTPGAGYDVRNKLKSPTNPFGIAVVQLSGKALAGDAAGNVWGNVLFVYHCRLTQVGAPQNIQNDATDPILRSVEFDTRYPDDVEQTTIYTGA
jgi:hypothetical protein